MNDDLWYGDCLWYGAWDCDQDWYGLVYRWRAKWGWKEVVHQLGPYQDDAEALDAVARFMRERSIEALYDFGKTPNQERIVQ
jgi:hypothetical protein